MPPIDPLQLLKALAPLLATTGGMKSAEEVMRLSSLMKKFSRKLVSRCVYVNVLRVTSLDVLEAFLDQGGWETINNWLQDAKKSENYAFLIDLLRLFQTLPMTVGRLKQNNSAKVVKALTKSDSEDVKSLATELVDTWMKLVKGNTPNSHEEKVVKKKRKRDHKKEHEKDKKEIDEKDKKERRDSVEKKSTSEKKNSSVENDVRRVEKGSSKNSKVVCELEDVKLPEYLEKELTMKKPKKDRPKTVKTFPAKFRSTGLEEPPPLPKAVSKKAVGVDKAAALAAKHAVKRIGGAVPRDSLPFEKKSKPTSPMVITESNEQTEKLGIKLIPAKPKPIHVIKESAGFMDALVAEPSAPTRKKRKSTRTPTTPPSPTLATPKLQFYKDTFETQSDSEKNEDKEVVDCDATCAENVEGPKDSAADVAVEIAAETPNTDRAVSPEIKNAPTETTPSTAVPSKSKTKRKRVSWAEEPKLKQIYYFEMDETERVNVNNEKNFGDMKTLERQKERQVVESARRMLMGDKMEERAAWVTPFLIDMPPPLVDRGCNSLQRDIQRSREQSILQEIYFSKESIPDTPHEPDPEMVEPHEPKSIPLEDENNPDSVVDYSSMEPPAPVTSLPPALTSLMHSLNHKQMPNGPYPGEMEMQFREEVPPEPFYKTGPPPGFPPGLLGCAPPGFEPFGKFPPPPGPDNLMPPPPPQGDMNLGPPGPPNMMMPPPAPEEISEYYDPMGPSMHHPQIGGPHTRMNGPPRNRGSNRHRGMGPLRGPMRRGGPRSRSRGGRIVCRHFAQTNTCRYEDTCLFIHPGVNGPMC